MLDAVVAVLPKVLTPEVTEVAEPTTNDQPPTAEVERPPAEVKVAIIGHPNVGKSTLLNCLTASDDRLALCEMLRFRFLGEGKLLPFFGFDFVVCQAGQDQGPDPFAQVRAIVLIIRTRPKGSI